MIKLDSLNGLPKIAVCLAAFNGTRWFAGQLDSILTQICVAVIVFVSVDASIDGTEDFVDAHAQADSRIIVLPHGEHFGGAAPNFFRILRDIDLNGFDYICFADQDDIWEHDKLIRHVRLIKNNDLEGVSSNVLAFWPDGKTKFIDKAQPERELDFIFESAGPGCTFMMTPWLVGKIKDVLGDKPNVANQVDLHDWLVYAVCRALGKRWHIDSTPSLQYRQHDKNVVGANSGIKAKLARLKKISNGWYRAEVLKILSVTRQLSNDPKLEKISRILEKKDFLSRLKLLQFIPQARRKMSDRIFLALMIIFGLF